MPLDPDFIKDLLKKENVGIRHLPMPQTSNFVRYFDKEMRCASRGCSSPTFIRVKGTPYCTPHVIQILADLLDEQINHYPNRSTDYEGQLKLYFDHAEGEKLCQM